MAQWRRQRAPSYRLTPVPFNLSRPDPAPSPMLRSLVLILLLLNLAFFSWTQGWLTTVVGVHPSQQHEPQRLTLQRHADQLEVIPPEVMPSASAASAALAQAIASAASAASEGDDGAVLPAALPQTPGEAASDTNAAQASTATPANAAAAPTACLAAGPFGSVEMGIVRSEEHTSELQSQSNLVCRLLPEKKNPLAVHEGPIPAIRGEIQDQRSTRVT